MTHLGRALRTLLGIAGAGAVLLAPHTAIAVSRTCGSDPAVNTTNVLCASPSGPCDGSTVRLSSDVEVTNAGCTFDLGGRALIVSSTFQMVAGGFIKVTGAGNVSITSTGKLKARGDFGTGGPDIELGGTIAIQSTGTITHEGLIDVYGDPGGSVKLGATGTLLVASGSLIRSPGNSSATDGSERLADGGRLELTSSAGSVNVYGDLAVDGQSSGAGGNVRLRAARNIQVTQPIVASGGEGGGGTIIMLAGDDITVTKTLDAESRSGGGSGGDIDLEAGEDSLGGVVTGGTLGIGTATLKVNGSSSGGDAGDAGTITATSHGDVLLASDAAVQANAGVGAGGTGGTVELDAGVGDLTLEGPVSATAGTSDGEGGSLSIAGTDVTVAATATVVLNGSQEGGDFHVAAAGSYTQASTVRANGLDTGAAGGTADVDACTAAWNGTSKLETTGTVGGTIDITGKSHISVGTTSQVKATGTTGSIRLATRAFGHCSNDPSRSCRIAADCTIGCNTGQCLDVNPDTGGSTTQFDPAPVFVADASLPACP